MKFNRNDYRLKSGLVSIVLLYVGSFSLNSSTANAASKQDKNLLWSQSYLINTIFIQEYQALIEGTTSEASAKQFSESKNEGPLARAIFSLQSSKKLGQRINDYSKISDTITQHIAIYSKEKNQKFPKIIKSHKEQKQAKLQLLDNKTAAEISKTFNSSKSRKYWEVLNPAFNVANTNCSIDFKTISNFANHQLALSKDGRTPNANELLAPIKNWKTADLQCLVFAFMSASPKAKTEKGYEPLNILMALRQTGTKEAQDTVLRINTVTRLLQKSMYPESLGLLVSLQESVPAYRLAYDMVQRVYSIRQRGAGQVAIKGL